MNINSRNTVLFTAILAAFVSVGCGSSSSDPQSPVSDNMVMGVGDGTGTGTSGQTDSDNEAESSAWKQVAKFEAAPDKDVSNAFIAGDSVLVSGSGGIDSFRGSVRLLERDSDANWNDSTIFAPADLASGDQLGSAMALSGNTVFIASPGDDDDGSVTVFERVDSGDWIETEKLFAEAPAKMGEVSLSGTRALVGGSNLGKPYSGAAYVYERDINGSWQRAATLRPADADGFDWLGWTGQGLALSGDRALVSSPSDDLNGVEAGAVYVFERDPTGEWSESAKLIPADSTLESYFGFSVALSGDVALVGRYNPFDRLSSENSAYIFERNSDGEWLEVAKLNTTDNLFGTEFGRSVSLDGNRALVGAPATNLNTGGTVYVFERNPNGNWDETDKLSVAQPSDDFGWAVSLSGDRALVSAPGASGQGTGEGAAYLFELDSD